MKQLNEVARMQQLAGILNENEEINSSQSSFSPETNSNFKWNEQPYNPEGVLEDLEGGGTLSKAEFWENDIQGIDPSETQPNYGRKESDGTWVFTFDVGEIRGFIEGEDFTL